MQLAETKALKDAKLTKVKTDHDIFSGGGSTRNIKQVLKHYSVVSVYSHLKTYIPCAYIPFVITSGFL